MRFAFIGEREEGNAGMPRDERVPVELMCEVLEVSRAGLSANKPLIASWGPSEGRSLGP